VAYQELFTIFNKLSTSTVEFPQLISYAAMSSFSRKLSTDSTALQLRAKNKAHCCCGLVDNLRE